MTPLTTSLVFSRSLRSPAGVRAVHLDGHPGPAAGGQRNGPRLHVRHAQTPAHDHERDGKGPDPDVPQLARLAAAHGPLHGPAHERHGLRGAGPHLPGVRIGEHGRHKGVKRLLGSCRFRGES